MGQGFNWTGLELGAGLQVGHGCGLVGLGWGRGYGWSKVMVGWGYALKAGLWVGAGF